MTMTATKQPVAAERGDARDADSRVARVTEIMEMLKSDTITDTQIEQFKGVVIGIELANAAARQA